MPIMRGGCTADPADGDEPRNVSFRPLALPRPSCLPALNRLLFRFILLYVTP